AARPATGRGLDRLAVDDGGAGLRVAPGGDAHFPAQGGVPLLPQFGALPISEVTVDSLPGGEVVRQHAPTGATGELVEDGIDDLAHILAPGVPTRLGGGNERREPRPFHIGQIGGIGFAVHSPMIPLRSLPRQTFKTLSKGPATAASAQQNVPGASS